MNPNGSKPMGKGRMGIFLKLLSGVMMAGFGGVLVFAPERLNDIVTAFMLLASAIFVAIAIDYLYPSGARS